MRKVGKERGQRIKIMNEYFLKSTTFNVQTKIFYLFIQLKAN